MTAASLAPFLAPAAGTVAFLILLSVTIGAVLSLAPFSRNGELAESETNTQSFPWTGLPIALSHGVQTEESTASNLRLTKQASSDMPKHLMQETHAAEPSRRDTSANLAPVPTSHSMHGADSDSWSPSAVRWWGINE